MAKNKLGRRELLKRSGMATAAVAVAPVVSACGSDSGPGAGPDEAGTRFIHGVASGDPTATSVILWTRVEPGSDTSISVDWIAATDRELTEVVASGTETTDASRDFTVKVDATGLSPATTYYYQFSAVGQVSTKGRTKTAPMGASQQLRFGVVSCSSYAHGYFHGYRNVAERADLDAVIHLGDYIYEYGTNSYGMLRPHEPSHEIITLEDYRLRYSQYRRDPDLQACHRQHPFIVTWDDHETANNSYHDGAGNHDPLTEGSWEDRKAAAFQAYLEWMPIRPTGQDQIIYRTVRYGELVDLFMLDTRIAGRDMQVESSDDPALDDPNRSLLGATQEAWLFGELSSSNAKWKLLGQQVMMGQIPLFNDDQWDGYPHARERLLTHIRDNSISNPIVLTGDIHTSWVIDITEDPNDTSVFNPTTREGALAVEFVCPGITSPGLGEPFQPAVESALVDYPHIVYANVYRRGYYILNLDDEKAQAAFYHVEDITDPEGYDEEVGAVWATADGANNAVEESSPEPARGPIPRLA